jgi:hypothetical protein
LTTIFVPKKRSSNEEELAVAARENTATTRDGKRWWISLFLSLVGKKIFERD